MTETRPIYLATPRAEREATLDAMVLDLERRLGPAVDGLPVATCADLRHLEERVRRLESSVAALLEWWERAE
jgi:polyhydroxyalkanoate synthesis regulator phasin